MDANIYAKAIYESAKNSNSAEMDSKITKFIEVLKKTDQLHLLPSIIRNITRISQQEKRGEATEIISSKPLSESEKKDLIQSIKNPKAKTSFSVDETLIGGTVTISNETRTDKSFKRNLLELYKSITK